MNTSPRLSRSFVLTGALLALALFLSSPALAQSVKQEKAMDWLNSYAAEMLQSRPHFIGYPINQDMELQGFYKWYMESGLYEAAMNNVGDPYKPSGLLLNTHPFERDVIDYFAPRFGFDKDYWGFVTASGTDGNNHGVYFGKKVLQAQSDLPPLAYVSEEAHYSIKKLADVQGVELRLIKADPMGRMDLADFEAQLDPTRPALVVIAMGTTFKGGIDNQMGINAILEKAGPPAVYRHQDAALFGSILGFLPPPASDLVNSAKMGFDSIAISGHKFWGLDEPAGVFISTQFVRDNINPFQVAYLKDAVPTITCSRSAISPLKLWWKITFSEPDVFEQQAAQLIANAEYLHAELQKLGIKSWLNEYSNTVFFERPSQIIMDYYGLAPDVHPEQGELAHVLLMQHVSKDLLDAFIADMKKDFGK
ncbi:aminotransferase class V-fold PLP-dependent enzyme [Desulfonatronum sp. SC1]|uniref:aminotransferase class V-fold PLP-dependent enzyme n=1 Tax=Desulfonatronum sp. SC1 TaxID=2109626 RepID=UPI000D2F9034|nr:aminotransferase class V-fold PLP-dependent enzyme [Desulfonatronum sp. SC1]PTN31465.1 pyridoxal-dependent decarboxylase [Desulfonatronum sp. SC1]